MGDRCKYATDSPDYLAYPCGVADCYACDEGGIATTSEITVVPVQQAGGDAMVLAARQASTDWAAAVEAVKATPTDAQYGKIAHAMRLRHGSVFEHSSMTFAAHAPAFVWWEWVRHRWMVVDCSDMCVAGGTVVTLGSRSPDGRPYLWRRTIAELHRNWHIGVHDHRSVRAPDAGVRQMRGGRWLARTVVGGKAVNVGTFATKEEAVSARLASSAAGNLFRVRPLPACRNISARVLNEDTQLFEFGKVVDIFERGVQELLAVESDSGHRLRCTKMHRILTGDGWKRAGDLESSDWIAAVGKRSRFPDRVIPKRLRQGIGLWATGLREKLIRDDDRCHTCGEFFARKALILDHVIPVAASLKHALDESNLMPICIGCNRLKTASEQSLARRGNVAGSKFVRLAGKPKACGEEMTYDIEMAAPWHNYLADGIVTHNSFNLESGRYQELKPVFWVPRRERPVSKTAAHKPSRPDYAPMESDVQFAANVETMRGTYRGVWANYRTLLAGGFPPEVSRAVLGFGVYYSGWVTTNARALMHFLGLRTRDAESAVPSYPLWEIEEAARQCEAVLAAGWPLTYKAFVANGRVAP